MDGNIAVILTFALTLVYWKKVQMGRFEVFSLTPLNINLC